MLFKVKCKHYLILKFFVGKKADTTVIDKISFLNMRRGTNQRAPRRIVDRSNGEWDEFDPRLSDYYDDNCYTSGPGLHLPPNVPYSMR